MKTVDADAESDNNVRTLLACQGTSWEAPAMHQRRRRETDRSWRMSRRATVSTFLLCAVLCGLLILMWRAPGTSPRTRQVAALQAARKRRAKTGPRHYQL